MELLQLQLFSTFKTENFGRKKGFQGIKIASESVFQYMKMTSKWPQITASETGPKLTTGQKTPIFSDFCDFGPLATVSVGD